MFKVFLLGSVYPVYASYKSLKSNEIEDIKSWLTYWMTFILILSIYQLIWFIPFTFTIASYILIHLQYNKDFRDKLLIKYTIPSIMKYKFKLLAHVHMKDAMNYLIIQYVRYTTGINTLLNTNKTKVTNTDKTKATSSESTNNDMIKRPVSPLQY